MLLTTIIALAALVVVVLGLVLALGDDSIDRSLDDVDPLFPTGIAIAGAGVALSVTIGAFMFALLAVGLIVMAVGATRSRHSHR